MKTLESPQILSDLYRDLRDRRLLPIVVVLLVGMAVVPIALSSSPEAAPPPPPVAPVAAKTNVPSETVVVSSPGLRNYKKRLSGDAPTDPFIQQFPIHVAPAAPAGGAAGSSGAAADTSGTSGTTTSGGGSVTSSGTTTTVPQPKVQSRLYFYRVKVRAGQLGDGDLKTYDSVGSMAPLPNKKAPVVTFLGANTDNSFRARTAVFLVNSAVSSVEGEGTCSFAGTACQLLTLKPGEHEDLVWVDGSVYRIQLVKFNLIARHDVPSGDGKNSGGGDSHKAGRYFSF